MWVLGKYTSPTEWVCDIQAYWLVNEHLKHIGRCNTPVFFKQFLHPVDGGHADASSLLASLNIYVFSLPVTCRWKYAIVYDIYIHAYTVTSI